MFLLRGSLAEQAADMQKLRARWRTRELRKQVQASRRDAAIARSIGLDPSQEALHGKLKSLLNGATGREVGCHVRHTELGNPTR